MPKPPCSICGKPALFIIDGNDICRDCHPPHSEDTRNALNALRLKGLI